MKYISAKQVVLLGNLQYTVLVLQCMLLASFFAPKTVVTSSEM